jgi:hypothetical protein
MRARWWVKEMGRIPTSPFADNETRAEWRYTDLSYFPEVYQESGAIWRRIVETDGLELAAGDRCCLLATVIRYSRRDGTATC